MNPGLKQFRAAQQKEIQHFAQFLSIDKNKVARM
jgi:hypothetical protein